MAPSPQPMDPTVETWALEFPGRLSREARAEILAQLMAAIPHKHVVVVEEGAHFRALEPLAGACAEAEAIASEKGLYLSLKSSPDRATYTAQAWSKATAAYPEAVGGYTGPTPADALHGLAAGLRR